MSSPGIETLLRHPSIWRAGHGGMADGTALASGFPVLDAQLPGGGWPGNAITEILAAPLGAGELGLVLPALARLSRAGHWLAWIAPPWLPYAPALSHAGLDLRRVLWVRPDPGREALWATEQALRAGCCGAVLAWPGQVDERSLRRLQLAAEAGGSWGVLFREQHHGARHSPAALRLEVWPSPHGIRARIIKCRGRGPSGAFLVKDHERPPAAMPSPVTT